MKTSNAHITYEPESKGSLYDIAEVCWYDGLGVFLNDYVGNIPQDIANDTGMRVIRISQPGVTRSNGSKIGLYNKQAQFDQQQTGHSLVPKDKSIVEIRHSLATHVGIQEVVYSSEVSNKIAGVINIAPITGPYDAFTYNFGDKKDLPIRLGGVIPWAGLLDQVKKLPLWLLENAPALPLNPFHNHLWHYRGERVQERDCDWMINLGSAPFFMDDNHLLDITSRHRQEGRTISRPGSLLIVPEQDEIFSPNSEKKLGELVKAEIFEAEGANHNVFVGPESTVKMMKEAMINYILRSVKPHISQ